MNPEYPSFCLPFQSLPLEIHDSIAEYLPILTSVSLSQSCRSLRSIYSSHSVSRCFFPTHPSFVINEPMLRKIPLKVFLNPQKYSWFNFKAVKYIIVDGEPTRLLMNSFSENLELSPLSYYSSLMNLAVMIPNLISFNTHDYIGDEAFGPFSEMIKKITISPNYSQKDKFYNLSLNVPYDTLLEKAPSIIYNIKTLILNDTWTSESNFKFPDLPNLTKFYYSPSQKTTFAHYTDILSVVTRSSFLEHVTVFYYHDDPRVVENIMILPETLPYCEINLSIEYDTWEQYSSIDTPLSVLKVPQITHLSVIMRGENLSTNSIIPRLRLPRITSIEGNLENKWWLYILAKDNGIWALPYYEREMEYILPQDISCNRLNITILDLGNFTYTSHPAMSCYFFLLSNFTKLRRLTISLETIPFVFKEMYDYLDHNSPINILQKRFDIVTSMLKIFSNIHQFFCEAAAIPELVDIVSSVEAYSVAEKITSKNLLQFKSMLCSTTCNLSKETMSMLMNQQFTENKVPDYERLFPKAYNQIKQILSSMDDPLFATPSILLEMILRPEVISFLSISNPVTPLKHFPTLNNIFGDQDYVSPGLPFFKMKNLTSLSSPAEETQKICHLINTLSLIFSKYSEQEHLLKVILNDLPDLEYLTVNSESPFLAHSFWLQSVFNNHANLKHILTEKPSYIYECLDKRINVDQKVLNLCSEGKNKLSFFQDSIPKSLKKYVYNVDSNYCHKPYQYIKYDVEGYRNEFYTEFELNNHIGEYYPF